MSPAPTCMTADCRVRDRLILPLLSRKAKKYWGGTNSTRRAAKLDGSFVIKFSSFLWEASEGPGHDKHSLKYMYGAGGWRMFEFAYNVKLPMFAHLQMFLLHSGAKWFTCQQIWPPRLITHPSINSKPIKKSQHALLTQDWVCFWCCWWFVYLKCVYCR